MKVLFFDSVMPDALNGGNVGMQRNLIMAKEVFGNDNVYECTLSQPSKLVILNNFLFDRSYYYSKENQQIIKNAIKEGPFDFIFLNGPLVYKYVLPFIKENTIIYLYCHNVDYEYYYNKYRLSRSLKDYFMSKYILKMESFIINKATMISTLNHRDAKGIRKWYNRYVDFILPIGMESISIDNLSSKSETKSYFGLFVGSSIGPNIEGLKWFFESVAPYTPDIKYYIIGTCCEYFKDKNIPDNIILKGTVDNLTEFYRDASFVICPIFSGSGMKTKTIEALKFGKTVIGTTEAFEGIDIEIDNIGIKSDRADQQIAKIKSLNLDNKLNEKSLKVFLENFSYNIIFNEFKNQTDKIINDNKK